MFHVNGTRIGARLATPAAFLVVLSAVSMNPAAATSTPNSFENSDRAQISTTHSPVDSSIMVSAADPQEPVVVDESTVRADVSAGETAEISIAVETPEGGLRIDTRNAVGPEATVDAVRTAASEPDVLAVGVAQSVTILNTDPYRSQQYALDMLCIDDTATRNLPGLCPTPTSAFADGTGQVVAILDSGVFSGHADLASRLVPGARCVGNSCVAISSTAAGDVHTHGTMVAGLVGAATGNSIGIAGTASGAKLMPVQVLDSSGSGNTAELARGIQWAVDQGATVINVSAGTSNSDPTLQVAVRYALERNVSFVAAAGNAGVSSLPFYPAAYDGVIGVGSVDQNRGASSFSSRGAWVDVVAPGQSVVSTSVVSGPASSYASGSGTSFAAPITSAVVAMLRQANPGSSQTDIASMLMDSAVDLGVSGRDATFGWGLIDPVAGLSPITQRWRTLGGSASVLGAPIGVEKTGPIAGSRMQQFQRGAIYWSAATGAHDVYGDIYARYASLSPTNLAGIGLPTSGEKDGPFAGSRMNSFQRGGIYWSATTGAHDVYGDIYARYASLSPQNLAGIGLPTSGETNGPLPGSRMNGFQRGGIYWSATTGAHDVYGDIYRRYATLSPTNLAGIGLPTSGETDGPLPGSRMNSFQRGGIYWSATTGAHDVYGAIAGRYMTLSPTNLAGIGLPTSGEKDGPLAGSRMNTFQRGGIYWSATTGAHDVYGDIYARYASLSPQNLTGIGLPTSGEYSIPGGRANNFVNGRIAWTPALGAQVYIA